MYIFIYIYIYIYTYTCLYVYLCMNVFLSMLSSVLEFSELVCTDMICYNRHHQNIPQLFRRSSTVRLTLLWYPSYAILRTCITLICPAILRWNLSSLIVSTLPSRVQLLATSMSLAWSNHWSQQNKPQNKRSTDVFINTFRTSLD